jgi:hypothetical protein
MSIDEIRELERRKRKPTDDDKIAKKPTTSTSGVNDLQLQSKTEVPTRKFFTPLRPIEMKADRGDDADDTTERQQRQTPSSQAGRLNPSVLTSQVNLTHFQRQLKGLLKDNFEFRNIRNETRFVTKEMADFSAIRCHFESNNLP